MNGIELKTVNPVVFDDISLCGGESGQCKFRGVSTCFSPLCKLFDDTLLKMAYEFIFYKCQECKDHYKRNKK